MKLIIATVTDQDADRVMTALMSRHVGFTRINSTGNIFSPGHTTLMIGLDDAQVSSALDVMAKVASPRIGTVPYAYPTSPTVTSFAEVEVGGFIFYVLDVAHFEQV